jgi:long-chain acyl-CoA synthetase
MERPSTEAASSPQAKPGAVGTARRESTAADPGLLRDGHEVSDPAAQRAEHEKKGMALAWWAREQPEQLAVFSPNGDRTFKELNARANQLARALRRRGLEPGASVALICANRPEFAETVFACRRGGYRLTPINWHLSGPEAGYIVDDCDASTLIADHRFTAVALDAARLAPRAAVRLVVGGPMEGFEGYDDALAAEDPSDLADPVPGTSMLYTSGTTGRPKGVSRPPVAASLPNLFGYRPGDVHLCTGPLYHAAPLAFSLLLPLTNGAAVVLMDGWDAEESLRLVEQRRVTHTHVVPTMFVRLTRLPREVRDGYDLSSLRHVIHGAAPCPVHVKREVIDWLGPIVYEYYAATEGLGTLVDPATWLARPGTVGRVQPPDQVVIGDPEGNELPRGSVGLVYLKAPAASRFHYYKDDEKTASSYRGEHFTLGDMGYMDEDGYLFLTDRAADLVISGGVNIYPAEVDAVILEHPAVADVATIGVPDPEWGEAVKSVVELVPGTAGTPELSQELLELARAKLAHYKCPQTVDFADVLPREDNGKIYKRRLREQYRTGQAPPGGASDERPPGGFPDPSRSS